MSDIRVRWTGDAKSALLAGKQVEQQFDRVDRQAVKTRSSLDSMIASLGTKALVGAAAGVGLVGTAVGVAGFKFDALKQQAQTAFTVMLGDGAKAKAFLDDLAQFAAKTPFEFPDLIRASQRMLSMGFAAKDIKPTLTAVGDAVAAIGGDPQAMDATIRALGQIQAKGRLMAEEMMQLNEAGTFSWKNLAAAIGTDVPKAMELVRKGAVDSDTFMKAFVTNTEQRLGGMMEKQSHSFNGLLSTIKDTFAQVSGRVMEPFFEDTTAGMQRLVDYTSSPEFTAGVERFADFMRDEASPAIKDGIGWLIDHREDFLEVLTSGAQYAKGLAGALQAVHKTIRPLVEAVGGWDDVAKIAFGAVMLKRIQTLTLSLAGSGAAAGGAAAGAAVRSGGLLGALRALTASPWVIPIVLSLMYKDQLDQAGLSFLKSHGLGFLDQRGDINSDPEEVRRVFGDEAADALIEARRRAGVSSSGGGGLPGGGIGANPITSLPVGQGGNTKVAAAAVQASFGSDAGTYVFGAIKPGVAFDCSGLVVQAYRKVGIELPHNAALQFRDPRAQDVTGQEEPGDAVYFNSSNPTGGQGNPGHCGIYLGGDKFVEYYQTGKPARVSSLSANRYRYAGARRWVVVKTGDGGPVTDRGGGTTTVPVRDPGGGTKPKPTKKGATIDFAADIGPADFTAGLKAVFRNAGVSDIGANDFTANLKDAFEKAQKTIREGVERTAREAAALKTLRTIAKDALADGLIDDSELSRIRSQLGGVKKEIAAGVLAAAEAANDASDRFTQAWDKFVGLALTAFDKAHQKLRERLQAAVTFDGIEFQFGSGDLTPTEKLLADMDKAAKEAQLQAAVDAAATEEERGQAVLAQQRYFLEEKARLERKAAEDALAAKQAAFDDQTELDRVNFEKDLGAVQMAMADRSISYDEGLTRIQGIFEKYQVPFEEKSSALGSALSVALTESLGALETTLGKLVTAIEALVRRMGGQVEIAKGFVGAMQQYRIDADTAVQTITTAPGYRPYWTGGIVGYVGKAAQGMRIPGTFTPVDSLIARVSPGELISTPAQAQRALWAMMNGEAGPGRGASPVFNFYGHVWDRDELIEDVRREFRRIFRENGSIFGAS